MMTFKIEYGIQEGPAGPPYWITADKDPLYGSKQFDVLLNLGSRLPPRLPIEAVQIAKRYAEAFMQQRAITNSQLDFLDNKSHIAHNLLDLDWKEQRTTDGLVAYEKKVNCANRRWYVRLTWENPHAI